MAAALAVYNLGIDSVPEVLQTYIVLFYGSV